MSLSLPDGRSESNDVLEALRLRAIDVRELGYAVQGKVHWMIYAGTMNAELFIEFLKRLLSGRQKKIILIVDNPSVHSAVAVKE